MRPSIARSPDSSHAPFSLAGRVAVVLGGTSGIGRAIALALAEAGADVVASARRDILVAGAAVFLATDAARFITGQMIVVDGGFLASGVNQ